MKHSIWGLLLLTNCLQGATVTWDDEATQIVNGEEIPEHRWHTKENWSGDSIPTATDDVKMLSGPLVEMFTNTAVVSTIESKIPFKLGDTLVVMSSGTFEDSITAGGNGRIRANGPVSFKCNNDLSLDTLEGSSFFTNRGTFKIGTRGIHPDTKFFNEESFSLVSGSTNIGQFSNTGTFDFGGGIFVGSSSVFTNRGTLQKEGSAVVSEFLGEFTQLEGKVTVGPDAELQFSGRVQEFKGGEIISNGTLVLTEEAGGVPIRKFDGLTGITGEGSVKQLREYQLLQDLTVTLPMKPGYQIGDLVFGSVTPSPTPVTFTNAGYLTIDGGPKLTAASSPDDLNFLSNLFINAEGATVTQDVTSNPSFEVDVENEGTWTSYGMKVKSFENTGKLLLEGVFGKIVPEDLPEGGTLSNNGEVRLGKTAKAFSTISTEYDQPDGNTTYIDNGELTLEGGSQEFNGSFEIKENSTLKINRGDYLINRESFILKGLGTATIGGSQLSPVIRGGRIENNLGLNEQKKVNENKGLLMRSGRLDLENVKNFGFMNWSGGTISGFFFNNSHLDISAGPPRILERHLSNFLHGSIVQTSSLNLAEEDFENTGSVLNKGIHKLHKGASISGSSRTTYANRGHLLCEDGASVSISCGFINFTKTKFEGSHKGVEVKDNSVLGFTNCRNITDTGELKGGTWVVEEGSEIIFLNSITVLTDRCNWSGPGANTVNYVDTFSSLTKTTDEVHSVRLEVDGVVSLGGGQKPPYPRWTSMAF